MFKLGDKTNTGKEVVGVKNIVHGKYFPNREIVQMITLKGKRNALYLAHVYQSGNVDILGSKWGAFTGYEILDGRSEEEKQQTPELIAIV